MTAAALLREATATLAASGVDSPAWDAERLLRFVLGWDRATLVARSQAELERAAADRFLALVARRAARVPLQQILGTQAFWRHEFLVTPDVLTPRPETELLVETALARIEPLREPIVVDVGTGSGCIALSLAAERADARVYATDLSSPALQLARANARRLGLEARVVFRQGDLLEPVAELRSTGVDLVVCNPPYVLPEERASLAPEVRDHEPAPALCAAEPHPLVYERLAHGAARLLRAHGALAVEIGAGQEAAVRAALERGGLQPGEALPDLRGITRVLVAGCRRR